MLRIERRLENQAGEEEPSEGGTGWRTDRLKNELINPKAKASTDSRIHYRNEERILFNLSLTPTQK
jgi:hypothetical protein